MSDNLDWMNKHLVLLRCLRIDELVKSEGYKIRPDLKEFFENKKTIEEVLKEFFENGRFKCACELLAYGAHRRACVWWVYLCVLSLMEELKINPAQERKIEDIAVSFEPKVPDFAKVEPPKPSKENLDLIEKSNEEVKKKIADLRASCDPEILKMVEEHFEIACQEFKKVHGFHPMEAFDKLKEKVTKPDINYDPNSPIFVEAKKLEEQVKNVRKETIDTIKSVIPPELPEVKLKLQTDALEAVNNWINLPNEENSMVCLNVGNECPDTPAGLLALSAFWAGGNLTPNAKQVVRTPVGLESNGLCQVLLMCALHKGGTRKLKERYNHYFDLAMEVFTGKNVWDKQVLNEEKKEKTAEPEYEATKVAQETSINVKSGDSKLVFKRWKPVDKKDIDKKPLGKK
ncbi:MAG: hypothetical protein MJ247_05210 [Alphaproteobacteria bacterium]|nr:hypothetical protein [Alphaproteobacteria bacterium]